MLNRQGRPTNIDEQAEHSIDQGRRKTFTGNRGIFIREALIFEIGSPDQVGVDLPQPRKAKNKLGPMGRPENEPLEGGLPGLSEPECIRHYVRLSRTNQAIDLNTYPLGSCTMKHNPRLNEKIARLPGFANVHPLQPQTTVQGAVALMEKLGQWLITLTGMEAVALSPKAGAHGELCGMMCIQAAHKASGQHREVVLVPDSAHGTNPATAAQLGYKVESIPAREDGRVNLEALKSRLGPDVAAVMITNPNTCGLFEHQFAEIADEVHKAGGYVYCDGANFNAIVGKIRPGDLGADAMHINLHKTFSTPHGGGGPGSGPVVLSKALAPFAPLPMVVVQNGAEKLIEHGKDHPSTTQSFGRMTAFHGQMGMFVRALSYMLSHGKDGLRQASEDAVLNANYVRASLRDVMSQPFGDRICMHEVLFDEHFLNDTGITTLDFAKSMIDEGFHPMTMYFPLVVKGAMLIEPTESESKANLDLFCAALRDLTMTALSGEDPARFKSAPHFAPFRRLDETLAARKPVLRYPKPS